MVFSLPEEKMYFCNDIALFKINRTQAACLETLNAYSITTTVKQWGAVLR